MQWVHVTEASGSTLLPASQPPQEQNSIQTPAQDLRGCSPHPTVPTITWLPVIPTVCCRLISCWGSYLEKLFLEKPNEMAVAAGCRELTHHGSEV